MVRAIHICCGSEGKFGSARHEPIPMKVDSNSVDIFRMPDDTITLTVGYGWQKLALKMGANDFEGMKKNLERKGGDYHGCADRYVCPTCGATIVWRV